MGNRFIEVEYDLEYSGGNYSDVGDFAMIPVELVDKLGVEAAFEKHTGHDRVHIIHYCPDDRYNASGELVD
jgi:hypothetical protein